MFSLVLMTVNRHFETFRVSARQKPRFAIKTHLLRHALNDHCSGPILRQRLQFADNATDNPTDNPRFACNLP